MISGGSAESTPIVTNPFAAADVEAILRERGWLANAPPDEAMETWMQQAAALLGAQAADRAALCDLLTLVFHYDARAILSETAAHVVLAREGARAVIRELALEILGGPDVDSDRFKEIVGSLKERVEYRGRELFYPIRLALAGRAGEGGLDRVILLLDGATRLPFAAVVKGTRQRMLEFCAAME
jgi:hypothetical protein